MLHLPIERMYYILEASCGKRGLGMSDVLDMFHPAVSAWFRTTYGEPTPPQALGWPAIQRGEHILILSPTGSGKTMAAFL